MNPFPLQVVSGNILYAFVTDFLSKIPWKLREIPSVSLFRIKISMKPFVNKRLVLEVIKI